MKRIQSYSAPGITVTFDPNLCAHSGVCLMSLPAVFDVRRRRWVRPEAAAAAEVAATIGRCPSGALRYVLEDKADAGAPAEPPADEAAADPTTRIEASPNGPLLVEGAFKLLDEDGREIPTAGRAALCRCGGSGNKPFCDGTHRRSGFKSRPRSEA